MHSQPGVFAVLLGSGVSTGAGLPTGWQVVKQLVLRAAAAQDPDVDGPVSDEEVEAWWSEHGGGELGYSSLLETLAPTPAGRQAILEGFFEPATGDPEDEKDRHGPSAAHRALARLVAAGTVRVVLTTNFDRLMEQALEQVGIQPQIISRPEAVAGMKPLAHAPATVIKLHGDYKDLTTLNTPAELGDYPAEWKRLVGQVLDEYGLLISGWSADWDTALVHEIEASPARRYPLYWDSRSSRGQAAQRLLAHRSGIQIPSSGADELFTELESSVRAIEDLSEPPLTTAIAVARLKRYIHDPLQRIDLHDLVMSRLESIRGVAEEFGARPLPSASAYEEMIARYRSASLPLLELIVTGVRFDEDGLHTGVWNELLRRLLALRRPPDGTFNEFVWAAQHYPALLVYYSIGAACLAADRDELFIHLGRDLEWRRPFDGRDPDHAANVLRPDTVLSWDLINQFSRWRGTSWQQPPSHLVRADLHDVIADLVIDRDVKRFLDDVEYRHAVLVMSLPGFRHPLTGEYRGDRHWGGETLAACGKRFRTAADRAGAAWPWWSIVGPDLEVKLAEIEAAVAW